MGFFFQVSLEQSLKFLLNSLPSFLTSPMDGQSQPRIQKLIRPFLLRVGGGEGSLKFFNTSGGHKNFAHTVGGH